MSTFHSVGKLLSLVGHSFFSHAYASPSGHSPLAQHVVLARHTLVRTFGFGIMPRSHGDEAWEATCLTIALPFWNSMIR